MGLIENLGRVASSYMEEKEQLQIAGEKRVRTRTVTVSGRKKCFVTRSSSPSWVQSCCFTLG